MHLREREVDFTLPLLRLAFPLAQPSERVASRSKEKGDRDERGLIANLADHDIDAHRVPLSGAVEGYEGDVIIEDKYVVECKVRARGFQQIYGWLEKHVDFLTIRQDRAERLVVMRESMFIRMLLKFLGRGK